MFCNKTSLISLKVLSTQCISEIDLSYCGSNHPFHPWWFVIFNTLRWVVGCDDMVDDDWWLCSLTLSQRVQVEWLIPFLNIHPSDTDPKTQPPILALVFMYVCTTIACYTLTDPISQHPSFRHGSQDSTSHLGLGMYICTTAACLRTNWSHFSTSILQTRIPRLNLPSWPWYLCMHVRRLHAYALTDPISQH